MQIDERRWELWSASQSGDVSALENLFAAHPRLAARVLNQTGEDGNATALMRAAHHGHAEVVRWLLERGAMINQQGVSGSTALHYAVYYGHFRAVVELLRWSADPNVPDERGITPLQYAHEREHDLAEVLIASRQPWTPESHHVHMKRTRALASIICKLGYAVHREYAIPRSLWLSNVEPFLRLEPGAKVA